MEKTYKVITVLKIGKMYIQHSNTLETAKKIYDNSIEEECDNCYLLEEEINWSMTGDSRNRILSQYKNPQS